MCTNPIYLPDQPKPIACRVCNACIGSRINVWVQRCMAEKATAPHSIAVRLSYADQNGTPPKGALAFAYRDVQLFLKRQRKAISTYVDLHHASDPQHKQDQLKTLRYIVAGERGSKRGRVHYHLILFSHINLALVGKFHLFDPANIDNKGPRTGLVYDRNIIWNHWPHGHVYFQRPSGSGAFSYALKYALKDQFTVQKSQGTAREAKSENHGAGLFRMSKKPPIGTEFLVNRLRALRDEQRVPTTLKIKIPDYHGYWYPTGKQREMYLQGIHAIAEEYRTAHGAPAPQLVALLSEVGGNKPIEELETETDWSIVNYGEKPQFEFEHTPQAFKIDLDQRSMERLRATEAHSIKDTCGGLRPCSKCYNATTPRQREQIADYEAREYAEFVGSRFYNSERKEHHNKASFQRWYARKGRCNPWCVLGPEQPEKYRHVFVQKTPNLEPTE